MGNGRIGILSFSLILGLLPPAAAVNDPNKLFNAVTIHGLGSIPQNNAANFSIMTLFSAAEPVDFDNDGDMDVVLVADGALGGNINYNKFAKGFIPGTYLYTNTGDVDTNPVLDVSPNVFGGGLYPQKSGTAPTKGFPPAGTPYVGSDVGWLENDGFGGFAFRFVTINGGTEPAWVYNPRDVRVGDIDRDGDMDFVVFNNDGGAAAAASQFGGCTVAWFENRYIVGTSTIPPVSFFQHTIVRRTDLNGRETPRGGDLVDMDGDGDLDVLVADYVTGRIYWFENDDDDLDGTIDIDFNDFRACLVGGPAIYGAPLKIWGGDFDEDGDADILIGRNGAGVNGQVTLLKGTPGGINFAPFSVTGNNWPTESLAVADFNGDGRKDVVAGRTTLAVFLTNDGTFTGWTKSGLPNGNSFANFVINVRAVDMNRDFRPDIVAQFSKSGPLNAWFLQRGMNSSAHLWINRGGSWDQAGLGEEKYSMLESAAANFVDMGGLAVADYDGDGDQDILRPHGVYPMVLFENIWNTQRRVRVRTESSRGTFQQSLSDLFLVNPQGDLREIAESADRP